MSGIQLVDRIPGHARYRLAAGQRLGQLNLQRVHAGNVMDDDTDLAAVLGNTGLPLGVGEGGGQGGQRLGSLFEAIGKGTGPPAGGSRPILLEVRFVR